VQFEGFERLFARFLQEKGPSIIWDKISPPPEGIVSITFLIYILSLLLMAHVVQC